MNADRQPVHITIPETAWDDVDPDGGVLLATLVINGVSFHLAAVEVTDADVGSGTGQAALRAGADELDDLYRLARPDGPFSTVTVKGRPHVLYATPYPD